METETEERKEAWNEDCLKALAALANTRGGILWIGVRDDGSAAGWNGGGKEQETISNQIVNTLHVHPASLSVEQQSGLPVLAIRMHSAAAPVAVRGRYYRRVGNSTRELPSEELPRFLLERTGQTWDALPSEEGTEGLAQKAVEDFKVLARERLPQIGPSDTIDAVLGKLKLALPGGRLKRAALLLFGDDPQRTMPTAQIQIGRFRGEAIILDDRRVEGSLFSQITQAEQILRGYFLVRYEFPTGLDGRTGIEAMQRTEVWEFPYAAVREAVINALIHRDYTSTGRVQIRVYDDRMIVSNPGGLPAGLLVGDLLREPHDSLPRNPILAQVCYYANVVEQWGSGTIRMRDACRAQGVPDPVFQSTATSFSVTLYKNDLSEERLRRLGLNERQVQVIQYVHRNGGISNAQHQALTGAARRTAARDLECLQEIGLLERADQPGRTVYYVLAKPLPASVPSMPTNVP